MRVRTCFEFYQSHIEIQPMHNYGLYTSTGSLRHAVGWRFGRTSGLSLRGVGGRRRADRAFLRRFDTSRRT